MRNLHWEECILRENAVKVLSRCLEYSTVARGGQDRQVQFWKGACLPLDKQSIWAVPHRGHIPREGHSHGTILGYNYQACKHSAPRLITGAVRWRPNCVQWPPTSTIGVGDRGWLRARLRLTYRTQEFSMLVDIVLRTGNIDATTQRRACIEAVAGQKLASRRHVHAYIVAIAIIAIDRAQLVIDQAQLHEMGCATSGIESYGIVYIRLHVLGSFTRAYIRLHHVQPIVCGGAINLGCIAVLDQQVFNLPIGDIDLQILGLQVIQYLAANSNDFIRWSLAYPVH